MRAGAAREGRLVGALGIGAAVVVCRLDRIECEGEKLCVRDVQLDRDQSLTIRKKLLSIQVDRCHELVTLIHKSEDVPIERRKEALGPVPNGPLQTTTARGWRCWSCGKGGT